MAAMGRGTVAIRGLLQSDDTQVMIAALAAMGAGPFSWLDGGNILQLTGLAGKFAPPTEPLYLGNAGTAARFLTTCATLIHAPGAATTLTGEGRMKQRPIDDLTAALRQCGCSIEHTEPATSPASLPLRVDASGFPGGRIELSGRVSSQFVSSVLLSAPYAQQPARRPRAREAASRTRRGPALDLPAAHRCRLSSCSRSRPSRSRTST